LIYLDTSAFLKTMFDEPESPAINRYLEGVNDPRFVSSTLLAIEARRGALRANPRRLPRVDLALIRVAQIEMDGPVVETASRLPDPMLRSLDAIHLATALLIRSDVEVLLSYDQRMLAAAAAHGLPTAAPA
jgi:predicted nucleic acid-binding protein